MALLVVIVLVVLDPVVLDPVVLDPVVMDPVVPVLSSLVVQELLAGMRVVHQVTEVTLQVP